MSIEQFKPPHPGGFIKRVYLELFNLGSNEVARKLQISLSTFNRLLNEKTDISPEMALKLPKELGRSPESWMMMQDNFDLYQAREVIDVQNYEAIQFAG